MSRTRDGLDWMSSVPWWYHLLAIFGLLAGVSLLLNHERYSVRILDGMDTDDRFPVYLVRSRWWGFSKQDWPMRLQYDDTGAEWAYHDDDRWVPIGSGNLIYDDVNLYGPPEPDDRYDDY